MAFHKAFPEVQGSQWRWVLNGGKPAGKHQAAPTSGDILFTGHKDGRVRVWLAGAAVPVLAATVPFDSGGAGAKLRSVTALEVDLLKVWLIMREIYRSESYKLQLDYDLYFLAS